MLAFSKSAIVPEKVLTNNFPSSRQGAKLIILTKFQWNSSIIISMNYGVGRYGTLNSISVHIPILFQMTLYGKQLEMTQPFGSIRALVRCLKAGICSPLTWKQTSLSSTSNSIRIMVTIFKKCIQYHCQPVTGILPNDCVISLVCLKDFSFNQAIHFVHLSSTTFVWAKSPRGSP